MGMIDDAKETLSAAGDKIEREYHDHKDRAEDKSDEARANAEVKKAEADRDSVEKRNEIKEELRDT